MTAGEQTDSGQLGVAESYSAVLELLDSEAGIEAEAEAEAEVEDVRYWWW